MTSMFHADVVDTNIFSLELNSFFSMFCLDNVHRVSYTEGYAMGIWRSRKSSNTHTLGTDRWWCSVHGYKEIFDNYSGCSVSGFSALFSAILFKNEQIFLGKFLYQIRLIPFCHQLLHSNCGNRSKVTSIPWSSSIWYQQVLSIFSHRLMSSF